jgi:FkbM family methyltransferase
MNIKNQFIRLVKPVIKQFPYVESAYRYVLDKRHILAQPKETPMGFKFMGNPEMVKGTFEENETNIAKKILEKVDVVINVGANTGYYCCYALQRNKYVIAFEPIRNNLDCLYRNMRVNNWDDKIEIFPIALSNRIGIVEIFGGGTGASLIKGWAGASERAIQFVPTSTLDMVIGSRMCGKKCFFIVDIEGAEKLMLEGASLSMSAEPKPIWMVEVSIQEHQPIGISLNPHLLATFQLFWSKGYESWTAANEIRIVQPREIEQIVMTGEDSLFTHNFLFIENGKKDELLGA